MVLRYTPGKEAELAKALATGSAEVAASSAGVSASDFTIGMGLLGSGSAIITSDRALGKDTETALKKLADGVGAEFNVYPTEANAMGAFLLGVTPDNLENDTWSILAGLESGSIKSGWLVECDPASDPRGQRALENAEFIVYQGTVENETMAYANVVLPMAAPAEQHGTWTNCEGRVQVMAQAIPAPGEAKPAWRIFGEMILRLSPSVPYFSAREVTKQMSHEVDAFHEVDIEAIPDEGLLLNLKKEPALAVDGG